MRQCVDFWAFSGMHTWNAHMNLFVLSTFANTIYWSLWLLLHAPELTMNHWNWGLFWKTFSGWKFTKGLGEPWTSKQRATSLLLLRKTVMSSEMLEAFGSVSARVSTGDDGNSGVIPHFSTAVLNYIDDGSSGQLYTVCQSTFFLTVGQGDENQNLPRLDWLNHRHRGNRPAISSNQTTRRYITPPWKTLLPESQGISRISNHVKALPAAPVAKFIAFLPDTQVATEMVTPDQQPRGSWNLPWFSFKQSFVCFSYAGIISGLTWKSKAWEVEKSHSQEDKRWESHQILRFSRSTSICYRKEGRTMTV